jgi:hypothetical protein
MCCTGIFGTATSILWQVKLLLNVNNILLQRSTGLHILFSFSTTPIDRNVSIIPYTALVHDNAETKYVYKALVYTFSMRHTWQTFITRTLFFKLNIFHKCLGKHLKSVRNNRGLSSPCPFSSLGISGNNRGITSAIDPTDAYIVFLYARGRDKSICAYNAKRHSMGSTCPQNRQKYLFLK